MDEWMDFDDPVDDPPPPPPPPPPGYDGNSRKKRSDRNRPVGTAPHPLDNVVEPSSRPRVSEINVGSVLGFIAIGMIVIGFLLPWYYVDIRIDSEEYDTEGRRPLASLGGYRGFQFQLPENRAGNDTATAQMQENITGEMENFMDFQICSTCCLVIIIIAIILQVVFVVKYLRDDRPRRGNRFITHGVLIILPLVLILVMLPFATAYALNAWGPDLGEDDDGSAAEAALDVSRSVVSGSTEFELDDSSITIWWGFGLGLWLFIAGGATCILAGILDRLLSRA